MPDTQNTSGWLLWSVYELNDHNDKNNDHNDDSATRIVKILLKLSGKCPNTEFFLVRIFLYSDWIRIFTKRQPQKMVKHTQKLRPQKPTNCLSVFDHFVGLALRRSPYFVRIQENTDQKKLCIWTLFAQWLL